MTGHTFIQHFIQKEEPLVPHIIRHYSISVSLHMHSPFSFGFQSDSVFTCTLNRIRKGINHPVQSDRLRCLHEGFSVQLSRQYDYKRIIWLHVNVHGH